MVKTMVETVILSWLRLCRDCGQDCDTETVETVVGAVVKTGTGTVGVTVGAVVETVVLGRLRLWSRLWY